MSDLAEGSTIAGCQLEGVAGRGGMGVVYRATQLALGRRVAVKAIAGDLAGDADYRERFERESRIAAAIDHPNIIPVYEAGEFDGTLYLIMRWVDGTDLRTLLRSSGPLTPQRAVRLLRPVAAALSAAHRAGLVHRDVKPANVLIARGDTEDEEHVYLTDFGIARRTSGESAMTRTGMFVGTIDYTAPERIEGGRGDATSDIYSFGCMLFETLTGHIPFDRSSEVAKVFAHMNDPVPSARTDMPEVPEALDAIIARAMAKDPALRFSPTSELVGALGDLLHDLDTQERQRLSTAAGRTVPAPQPEPPAEPEPEPEALPEPEREREPGPAPEQEPAEPTSVTALAAAAAAAAPSVPRAPADVRIQRVRPRGRIALVAGGLVVVLVVVLAIALGGGGGGGGGGSGRSNPAVSGAGLSIASTVALGGTPAALSVGPEGNLWASLPDDGEVVRIGATAGRERTFPVGGHPSAIAASRDGLWVAGSAAGPLARFNLRTGRLEQAVQLTRAPSLLAADPLDGSVWAIDAGGAANHVSPSGATLGAPVTISPPPTAATAGEPNWLWAVNGNLVRVGNGTQPHPFGVHPDPVAVTLDQGVWTAHSNGHVTRFNPIPKFLNVNTDQRVAPELDGIAAVEMGAAVWTISKQTKKLYRLSTASGAPLTGSVTFASPPVAVAATAGGAWVATADGTLTQIAG